jgi:uncharacterized membrane protein YkoI
MKRAWMGLAVLCLSASCALAADQPVKMKDLPPAVQKTVQEQSKGATIRGLSKEIEDGKTFYEVELTADGHNKDILMDASGAVVEVEEQVALDGVPAAVKATIEKSAGTGKILKVELVQKQGKVSYEARIEQAGKKREITVQADGTLVRAKK